MEEKLINTIKEILEIEECTIETLRRDVDSWDSLCHVILIAEIQEKFQVNIPFDDIEKIKKVEDFMKYLR